MVLVPCIIKSEYFTGLTASVIIRKSRIARGDDYYLQVTEKIFKIVCELVIVDIETNTHWYNLEGNMKKVTKKSRDTFDEIDQKLFEKSLAKLNSNKVKEKQKSGVKEKQSGEVRERQSGVVNENRSGGVEENRKGSSQLTKKQNGRAGQDHNSKLVEKKKDGIVGSKSLGLVKNRNSQVVETQRNQVTKKQSSQVDLSCKHFKKCGGCQHLDQTYERQLAIKQKQVETLLKHHCTVHPITGMQEPYHYRNKVQAVFARDMRGNIISGVYKEGTHQVISVDTCLIEDQKADDIIRTIRNMLKSFKIKTYDEDTGYGLLRYVLVKRGFASNEIMVVLVIGSPIFPSKNNFVKALLKEHPEITTIVLNVNDRTDSMILGNKETTLYGKGYIEDTLCGVVFRISSKSFYQINPVQTEILYDKAMKAANLSGKETIIDAYCGIGTIGLIASKKAKEVIGIEINKDAYKDAIANAKRNDIQNVRFFNADASDFMLKLTAEKKKIDVVFLDPPRSGSTEAFIDAVATLSPKRVVYVSCNPMTLERDLRYFVKKGYEAKEAWPVDMFPWTGHVETVVFISKKREVESVKNNRKQGL